MAEPEKCLIVINIPKVVFYLLRKWLELTVVLGSLLDWKVYAIICVVVSILKDLTVWSYYEMIEKYGGHLKDKEVEMMVYIEILVKG